MELADYFEGKKGWGILATADKDGKVDLALYARPHAVDRDTVVFIMAAGHRTHDNLRVNPYAAYLFKEEGAGYRGIRLYLTKISEKTDPDEIEAFRRETVHYPDLEGDAKMRYLTFFRVNEVRPLAGSETKGKEDSGTILVE